MEETDVRTYKRKLPSSIQDQTRVQERSSNIQEQSSDLQDHTGVEERSSDIQHQIEGQERSSDELDLSEDQPLINKKGRKKKKGKTVSRRLPRFRSTWPQFDMFNDVLNKRIRKKITQSPFGKIYLAFVKMNQTTFVKSNVMLDKIANYFDYKKHGFVVNGKVFKLTVDDVVKYIGLPKEGSRLPSFVDSHSRGDSLFPTGQRLKLASIMDTLEALKRQCNRDDRWEQHIANLVMLEICAKFLFANGGYSINNSLVKGIWTDCDGYNWAEEVHDYLIKGLTNRQKTLQKNPNSVLNTSGCAHLILVWLCEKTNLIKPIADVEEDLKILKWDFKQILKNEHSVDMERWFAIYNSNSEEEEAEEEEAAEVNEYQNEGYEVQHSIEEEEETDHDVFTDQFLIKRQSEENVSTVRSKKRKKVKEATSSKSLILRQMEEMKVLLNEHSRLLQRYQEEREVCNSGTPDDKNLTEVMNEEIKTIHTIMQSYVEEQEKQKLDAVVQNERIKLLETQIKQLQEKDQLREELPSIREGAEKSNSRGNGDGGDEKTQSICRLNLAPRKKKLLVFDLNGLLVYRVFHKNKDGIPRDRTFDRCCGNHLVYKRPFAEEFMLFCLERFEVGIWSSAMEKNVNGVLDCVMEKLRSRLIFVWGQHHCTDSSSMSLKNKKKPLYFKELRRLWDYFEGKFSALDTLLIDDEPYKALLNPPYTGIFLDSYIPGNSSDDALDPKKELAKYLTGLAVADDVPLYLKENPFGRPAISSEHPDWNFYSAVLRKFETEGA